MTLDEIGPDTTLATAAGASGTSDDRAAKTAAGQRTDPPATDADGVPRVFGSFWIDRTEFALPVGVLQEVVNEPKSYTPVPLSPAHVVGLFCLRKMIVPVIDLRVLLGFPKAEPTGDRKVAIIENGDLCIGLLFDDTGGVINGTGATWVNFQPNRDGVKDVVVEGMLKLDDGARMVQLLDPYEILKIEKLPRVAKATDVGAVKNHHGQRLNCISFQLGHTNCAIDLRYVQEITEVPEVQKSAVAYGHILGNIELRGRTMPIVDFRGLIGNEKPHEFTPDDLRDRKLVILNLPEGHVGLLVYSIDNIMTFYESEILPFANVALPRHDLVSGCLVNGNKEIVILLAHDRLLRDELLIEAAQSCQAIYPSDLEETAEEKESKAATRETYILFTVEMQLSLDISCVSEIINRPESLLKPPYALSFVEGILNLRGELITLINPRILYDLPRAEVEGAKVLIFHKDKKKYGIVVDSVDEIVTTTAEELMDVPSINKKGAARVVSEDLIGCLQVPTRPIGSDPVLVLDVESMITRCAETDGIKIDAEV